VFWKRSDVRTQFKIFCVIQLLNFAFRVTSLFLQCPVSVLSFSLFSVTEQTLATDGLENLKYQRTDTFRMFSNLHLVPLGC
jgi:hypothetical protein